MEFRDKDNGQNGFTTSHVDEFEGRSGFRDIIQVYAICGDGEIIKRFKIIKRSGEVFNIPYALLPVIILKDNSNLTIRTHGVQIIVSGRNLSVLEEHLSQETLLWMRESPSGVDDDHSQVFIKAIETYGENMEI